MPYVTCPSCRKVGYTPPTHRAPHLCPSCGAALPVRRSVVPLSRLRQDSVDLRQGPALGQSITRPLPQVHAVEQLKGDLVSAGLAA
jgi:hypothetical protein